VQEYLFLICIHNIKTWLACFYHAKQELDPIADQDWPTSDLGFKALIIWDFANLVSNFLDMPGILAFSIELDRITTLFFILCWRFGVSLRLPAPLE
jgi:hypothetical protein